MSRSWSFVLAIASWNLREFFLEGAISSAIFSIVARIGNFTTSYLYSCMDFIHAVFVLRVSV
jgi:hypothetical protein